MRNDGLARAARMPAPARIAIILGTAIVAFLLARTIVTHKLSEAFYEQANLPLAYGINPRDGMIAGYLASTLQSVGKDDIADKLATRAIALTPLSARAVGTLAITGAAGDPALATRLLNVAAGLGLRDDRIQVRLARAALDRGNAAAAAAHLDAAAGVQGAHGEVRDLIDRMAMSPVTLAAIAARVAPRPTWRMEYILSWMPPLGSLEARGRILGTLIAAGQPVDDIETAAVVVLDEKAHGLPHAYGVWTDIARPDLSHFVYDPHFTRPSSGGAMSYPFVWQLNALSGIAADTDTAGAHPALHVTGDGTSVGMIATQLVRAPPGRHQLAVSARYSAPGAASAFRWALSCWNDQRWTRSIEPLSGSAVGSANFDFDIPSDGTCTFQQLTLQAQQAATPGRIEAWFDDVQIR